MGGPIGGAVQCIHNAHDSNSGFGTCGMRLVVRFDPEEDVDFIGFLQCVQRTIVVTLK